MATGSGRFCHRPVAGGTLAARIVGRTARIRYILRSPSQLLRRWSMINVLAPGRPRLVAIGLCYAVLTAVELAYFHSSMTLIREIGLSLQAGFAAALVYGGVARRGTRATRSSFASGY